MSRAKRNRTPQENEAISDKVEILLSEGYELDQATAIAFDMFRRGTLDIPRVTSQDYRRQRMKKRSLLQQIQLASELLGIAVLSNKKKNRTEK